MSNKSSNAFDDELASWIQENSANKAEYDKIEQLWKTTGALPKQRINVEERWQKFKQQHFDQPQTSTKTIKPYSSYLKIAAAVLLFVGLGLSFLWFSGSTVYKSGKGERQQVLLADGTYVTLVNQANLTVPRVFNWKNRKLELEGEALFKVAKNQEKPFTIIGIKTNTQVLGTAFRLCTSNQQNFIEVSEGKVAYWIKETNDSVVLLKGDAATVVHNKIEQQQLLSLNADAWLKGTFTFNKTPLPKVLAQLQDYYNFNLKVKEFTNLNCAFTGVFTDSQTKEEVIEELALAMNFTYQWQKNTLFITSASCKQP